MHIETELATEHRDCGPWRSYELLAAGDTLEELLADATITEIDQDGGEIKSYGLDYGNEATDEAYELIIKAWEKENSK
jgi:hypothetical protein